MPPVTRGRFLKKMSMAPCHNTNQGLFPVIFRAIFEKTAHFGGPWAHLPSRAASRHFEIGGVELKLSGGKVTINQPSRRRHRPGSVG